MKTSPSLRKKRESDCRRHSFAIACCIYLPALWGVWTLTGLSTENFTRAGVGSMVSISFAQIAGGTPLGEGVLDPDAIPGAEPVAEEEPPTEPESEEAAPPEPVSETLVEPEPEIAPEPPPVPEVISEPAVKPESKPEPKPKSVEKKTTEAKKVAKSAAQPVHAKPLGNPDKTQKVQSGSAGLMPGPSTTPSGPSTAGDGGIATLVYGQSVDPFLAEVKRSVESMLEYPRKARALRLEGTAVVQFIISTDGKLSELVIFESSGKSLLDRMALKAVQKAESIWSKPTHTVKLRLPVRFELKG